jgi:hypothetical protein
MDEEINFTIGDFQAQQEFKEEHSEFIRCLPGLNAALQVAFDRSPEPANLQDALIYDLSRQCVKRYSEVGLLCANGLGEGAFIVLRSMFEYLVTARYLHLHPSSADDFVDYLFVHLRTVHTQIERTFGTSSISAETKSIVEENFEKVRNKFTYVTGKGRKRVKSGWTDMGNVDMAIEVGLGDFVVLAHYLPIEKAHPSMFSVLENQEQRKDASSHALMISHRILIELLILQDEHYQIVALAPLIAQCLHDFKEVWGRYNAS